MYIKREWEIGFICGLISRMDDLPLFIGQALLQHQYAAADQLSSAEPLSRLIDRAQKIEELRQLIKQHGKV